MPSKKKKGAKALTYRFIQEKKHADGGELYEILDTVREVHDDLRAANIGIAWRMSGGEGIGKSVAARELERQMHGFDVVLVLHRDTWLTLDDQCRAAGFDHLLSCVRLITDSSGEAALLAWPGIGPKQSNDTPRTVSRYQTVKPERTEFPGVLARRGVWHHQLVVQQKALTNAKQISLTLVEDTEPKAAGAAG